MAENKAFQILKGHNFRVLEADGFDDIVFGCPPGMVKAFAMENKALPSHYVIPFRNLVSGRNNFDFEFIIYSFLFVNPEKKKISVYCTRDQKISFKKIIKETLFGPLFQSLLQAQFRKAAIQFKLSLQEQKRFDSFLKTVGADKKLFRLFENLLKAKASDPSLNSGIRDYFASALKKHKWLKGKKIPRTETILAQNYILCAQLKKEIDLFSLADQKDSEKFLNNLIEFHEFDKNKSVVVSGRKKNNKLKIVQTRSSAFEIIYKNKNKGTVDISHLDPPEPLPEFEFTEKPFMGVTFLGVGSGFTPKRRNSCLIMWSEGKGIMVDSVPDSFRLALNYGIVENDILYIFLSHVHSDHDTGLIESILSGKRIRVISTRIIFESFLRKLEAITCFSIDVIEGFIDFFEVEPHKKVKLPGFDSTYMTFDYSLHSIPSGRFTLAYRDETGKETVISHSGDTKYDLQLINEWNEQGFFGRKRYEEIVGFIWDADLIVHDIGGGNLHTKLKSLDHIEDKVAEKMILVHQHYDPEPHPKFRFGSEGQSVSVIPHPQKNARESSESGTTLSSNGLQKEREFLNLLPHTEVVKYQMDEVVFLQGDIGEEFYVILDGFAELIFDRNPFALYEKGIIFGELAVLYKNSRRKSTIRAKSPLTLLRIPCQLYKKNHLSRGKNQFPEFLDPVLKTVLSQGEIHGWNKGDPVFLKKRLPGEVHILLCGQVNVQDEDSQAKVVLEGGSVIGELEGAGSLPDRTSAVAATDDVYTLVMSRKRLSQIFLMVPSFQHSVYEKLRRLGSDLSAIAASSKI